STTACTALPGAMVVVAAGPTASGVKRPVRDENAETPVAVRTNPATSETSAEALPAGASIQAPRMALKNLIPPFVSVSAAIERATCTRLGETSAVATVPVIALKACTRSDAATSTLLLSTCVVTEPVVVGSVVHVPVTAEYTK